MLHLYLRSTQGFASKQLEEAFLQVDRRDFVPGPLANFAYGDQALPIGEGATISQPSVVLFMLNLLDVRSNQRILDIGSGSGWTTALLANAVGPEGKVFGIEIVPELVNLGRNNLGRYPQLKNWSIFPAGPQLGLPKQSPFDRILVSASGKAIPEALLGQLVKWGVMVLPVETSVVKVLKGDSIIREDFRGFTFVPLVNL